jgi:excisionase family DNA binding protein
MEMKVNTKATPCEVPERLITPAELAKFLSVKVTWVWAAARDGKIPCVRVGHYQRFDLKVVIEALEQARLAS